MTATVRADARAIQCNVNGAAVSIRFRKEIPDSLARIDRKPLEEVWVWPLLMAGFLAALCLGSPAATASTTQDNAGRLDLVVEVYTLGSAVSMFVLNDDNRMAAYRADALRAMQRIDRKISGSGAGGSLPIRQALPADQAMAERWKTLRKTLYADDRSGILAQGYTTESFMDFITAMQALRASLAGSLTGNLSDEQQLQLLVSSSVANYLIFSADPAGAFERNYNQEEDNVPATVARVDELLLALLSSAKNPEYRNRILATRNNWEFLRILLNNKGEAMAPWVVYGVGNQLIDSLQAPGGVLVTR